DEDNIDGQQDSVGQTDGFPRILEATWPVDIEAVFNGSDIQSASITSYNVRYSPIVLDIAYPNCGGGSLMKDGIIEVFQGLICKTVIGGINGVKSAINFMADKFLTVDPLNYPGAGVVVKD